MVVETGNHERWIDTARFERTTREIHTAARVVYFFRLARGLNNIKPSCMHMRTGRLEDVLWWVWSAAATVLWWCRRLCSLYKFFCLRSSCSASFSCFCLNLFCSLLLHLRAAVTWLTLCSLQQRCLISFLAFPLFFWTYTPTEALWFFGI